MPRPLHCPIAGQYQVDQYPIAGQFPVEEYPIVCDGSTPSLLVPPSRGRRPKEVDDDSVVKGPGRPGTGRKHGTLEKTYSLLSGIAHHIIPGSTWMTLLESEDQRPVAWSEFLRLANWKSFDEFEVPPAGVHAVPFRHLSINEGTVTMYVSEPYYYYNNVNRDPVEFTAEVLKREVVDMRRRENVAMRRMEKGGVEKQRKKKKVS